MRLYAVDTSTLLREPHIIEEHQCVVLACVLRELEKHKLSRDENLRYQARRATRVLDQNDVHVDCKDYMVATNTAFDTAYVDNQILSACVANGYGIITDDMLLRIKAQGLGIEVIKPIEKDSYVGYVDVTLEDKDIAAAYERSENNAHNLVTNQYLIMRSTHGSFIDALRWNGEKLVPLKLPPAKVIKHMNEHQMCAIDMLNNKDIPIKVIAGHFGSGKTLLNIRMALYHTNDKPTYNKIMAVRNPIGPGEEVGFLPGTKQDKVQDFFKPIFQQLDGEQVLQGMIQRGQLEFEIPFYMKGVSLNNCWILVDEAEDLDLKTLKLIGSRMGQGSCVVFSGDIQQAESKYKNNNGIKEFIDKAKGNPLVGIVVLKDNIRSSASQVFSGLA